MSLSVVPISSFPTFLTLSLSFSTDILWLAFQKTTTAVFLRRHLSIYASEYWGPPWSPRLQSRRSRLPHSTSPKSMTSLIVAAKTKPPETKTGSCGAFPPFHWTWLRTSWWARTFLLKSDPAQPPLPSLHHYSPTPPKHRTAKRMWKSRSTCHC